MPQLQAIKTGAGAPRAALLRWDGRATRPFDATVGCVMPEGATPRGASFGHSGRRLERDGANLVGNPRGSGTATWIPGGAGTGLSSISDAGAPDCATALLLSGQTGTTARMSCSISASAPSLDQGAPFSARVWFQAQNAAAIGTPFQVVLWETGGSSADEACAISTATFTEDWQVATVSGAILRTGRTDLRLFVGTTVGEAVVGAEYGLTAIQAEAAASLSSYIDGDLGEGYAWTGTPHASASTRAAGSLTGRLPSADPVRGGMALWLRPMWAGASTVPRTLLDWRGDAGRRLRLRHEDGDWRLEWTNGAVEDAAVVAASHGADGDVRIFAWWTPSVLALEVNGVLSVTPRTGTPPSMRDALVSLGADVGGGAHIDAVVGPWAWVNRPLNALDRVVLARTSRPALWPG